MQLRLQLYGTVQWVLGQRAVEVRGRARQDLLLSLVSSQGQARSVEFLLSEVWAEPPQSGRNAVQRHVSSLRNELAGLGVADPLAVLETVNGGYRIATGVDTDLWRAEDETSTVEDCENAGCQWWREPLVGSSWDRHRPLRARLNTAAARRFCELMKTGTGLSSDDAPSRVTSFLDHNLSTSAVEALAGAIERLADPTHQRQWLSVTQPLIASAQLPASIVDRFQELARTTAGTATKLGVSKLLHQCFDFWAAGRSNEALDLLESTQTQVPGDLSRRMIRWLVWLPPEDPSCRHIAAYLLQEVVAAPAQGERSLVALDSMCLNRIPDGRNLAEYEVEHAHETADHLRSLRVRYLLQLASPVAQVEMDIIDSLATIDHPDARVEAQRFRFLSALRRGDLEIAKERLSTYSRVVQEEWVGSGDDFAQMARAVLSLSSHPPARRVFDTEIPSIGGFSADAYVLYIANSVRALLSGPTGHEPPERDFQIALSCLSPPTAHAMLLLQALQRNQSFENQAVQLADQLPQITRDMHFHLVLVALALAAERLGDPDLAAIVDSAMSPWSGQILGLWPIDFLFGPADHWLDRLRTLHA